MKSLLKLRLKTKAALVLGTILFLTLFMTTSLLLRSFTTEIRNALQVKTLILGQELADEIGKALDSGLDLPDLDEIGTKCTSLTEEYEDLAFAAIADVGGKYVFHSSADRAGTTVESAIFKPEAIPKESVQMEVDIDGRTVFSTVIPLFDSRSQFRGMVVVGLKGSVVSSIVGKMRVRSTLSGAVSFVLILILTMLFISRQITRPLDRLTLTAAAVAEGDLTREIDSKSTDEIGDLHLAFNNMLVNLRSLQERVAASFNELETAIADMSSHADGLQTVSGKQSSSVSEISTFIHHMSKQAQNVTNSMENLSRTSEETSSSIIEMMASIEEVAQSSESLSGSVNETSSSMEEVIVSNREVAQNIDHLSQLISQTSTAVTQFDASIREIQNLSQDSRKVSEEVKLNAEKDGSAAVEETIKEMNTIRESVSSLAGTVSNLSGSVDNIGAILNVIDDVAEQTNLLALNAAIIAAQAGEHGRGFAVVADEIRELAERTSSSTKEISKVISGIQSETLKVTRLVQDGVERVDRGTEAVGRTDRALQKIIKSSMKSVEMSTRIAQATAEQSSGSKDMARSIHDVSERSMQITKATAEQARGSETIIRAMENMRELAEQLRRATVEQSSGARLIAKAGEGTSLLSNEVRKAAQEGSSMTDKAVDEVNSISTAAKETLDIASLIKEMADSFSGLSQNMKSLLSRFRT